MKRIMCLLFNKHELLMHFTKDNLIICCLNCPKAFTVIYDQIAISEETISIVRIKT